MGYVGGKPFSFIFILLRDKAEHMSWEVDDVLAKYHDIVHGKKANNTEFNMLNEEV